MNVSASRALPALVSAAIGMFILPAQAWDYQGHRMVNQIALASLPDDFPSFVKTPEAAERISFLAGEPDRWRNTQDLPVKHFSSPNHYIDFEQLGLIGMSTAEVPAMRYDFVTQFAAGRAAHADKFQKIDPEKNSDHTAQWPGFLPWQIAEDYGKLKSGFSYLKTFEELGTAEEIANAQANIIYIMGTMGHYVGDAAQPLHISIHHNGWSGENPNEYTTWNGIHSWIDGGFIAAAGIQAADLLKQVKPATAWKLEAATPPKDPVFAKVIDYVEAQHVWVEPLYQLDKKGAFRAENQAKSDEGKKFIERQLLTGGHTLAEIWLTAYQQAGTDTFLQNVLETRREQEQGKSTETPENAPNGEGS